MHVCYVDEAGCTGALPSASSPIQPVFILSAIALPLAQVKPLTTDFIRLKRKFFPSLATVHQQFLDGVLFEVKGAELRRDIALGTPAEQRHAIGFLDGFLNLLEAHQAGIFGRAWIKGISVPFDGTAVYTSSMQDICRTFQARLSAAQDIGVVIADSRNKPKNSRVSHSIFTQKYRMTGDPFDCIVEMPTFGHSDNHVGLQVADLMCSGFLFPMAVQAYCSGFVTSLHVRPGYRVINTRYGQRLKAMQYRYQDASPGPTNGRWRGGITVSDSLGKRSGGLLFK